MSGKFYYSQNKHRSTPKNAWGRHRSDTKTTRRNLNWRQQPLLAVCAKSMPYCVRKLQMLME